MTQPETRRGGPVGAAASIAVSAIVAVAAVLAAGPARAADVGPGVDVDAVVDAAVDARRPAERGALSGSVTLGPELASRKMRFSLYSDLHRKAPQSAGYEEGAELRNVVIYLERVQADGVAAEPGSAVPVDAGPPAAPLVVEQRDSTFVPHVLPVVRGSTVEFPNRDLVFHNVFSLSHPKTFDLGRYPSGESRAVTFDEPGIVKVFCHIHSDMSAVVLVLPNPYFATPDADGGYRIDGVPPGRYRAFAWHERARPVSEIVDVAAGATERLDFTIPLAEVRRGG